MLTVYILLLCFSGRPACTSPSLSSGGSGTDDITSLSLLRMRVAVAFSEASCRSTSGSCGSRGPMTTLRPLGPGSGLAPRFRSSSLRLWRSCSCVLRGRNLSTAAEDGAASGGLVQAAMVPTAFRGLGAESQSRGPPAPTTAPPPMCSPGAPARCAAKEHRGRWQGQGRGGHERPAEGSGVAGQDTAPPEGRSGLQGSVSPGWGGGGGFVGTQPSGSQAKRQ